MKIVVLDARTIDPSGDIDWSPLEEFGEVRILRESEREDAEIIAAEIGDAEAVFTNKAAITADVIRRCPGVKYVCILATGYDSMDLIETARRGIPVTNIPGYGTEAVAQHTIALLLELCNHVGAYDRRIRAGEWKDCLDFSFWGRPFTELAGKTMGIIGFGDIGRAVGRIARGLGMDVLACSRSHVFPELENEHLHYVSMDELLARSDVISLHCPLTAETERIINREAIAKMKDGVYILNTSRGRLIDEEALREALESGKVDRAAMDVMAQEPIPETSPLFTAPRCYLTPHIAWAPREARQRVVDIAAENLRSYIEGRPANVVNRPERM